MAEAVRLVIWDLDETFWKGTLSEGGIEEYVQAHHDIVVELAKRGIMSSICSKNDPTAVKLILSERKILEYFIFPSISWDPKGARVAQIIETAQLRPESVMFIDDNFSNRGEVGSIVPSVQIEDETFIPQLLNDPRFSGKNDENLTRLHQYKLLEARKSDEEQASGSNEEFLRGCNIRVLIEYDTLPHLDRAIELINRTNQLNFTKVRLSEQIDEARSQLAAAMSDNFRQCGLVRVIDKYGDYGFVGFFMLKNGVLDPANGKLVQYLEHYCFSCRTLGMLVERWLYDLLQRPRINVVGEVLTDLSQSRVVDWIKLAKTLDDGADSFSRLAPEIRVHGGCEANSIAHYLGAYSDSVVVTGNFHAGTNFFRINGSSLLLSACDRAGPDFVEEAKALGAPYSLLTSKYFSDALEGTIFVLGAQLDVQGSSRYRHKRAGWEVFVEPHGLAGINLITASDEEIEERLKSLKFSAEAVAEIAAAAQHVRANYDNVYFDTDGMLPSLMKSIFDAIPVGSKLVLVLDHHRVRDLNGEVLDAPWVTGYSNKIGGLVAGYPFVATVSFSDFIQNDSEILIGGNHYDRMVYYRIARGIVAAVEQLPRKGEKFAEVGMTIRDLHPAID